MQNEKCDNTDNEAPGGQPCWLQLLYLGIPGVLHPSVAAYRQAHGVAPWEHGHEPYEGVPVLERALAGWDVHLVLTSREPCLQGMVPVLDALGDCIARRVIGSAYDHLTRYRRPGRSAQLLTAAEYGELGKAEVVRRHLAWMRPAAWVAVDAGDCGWGGAPECAGHVVRVDGYDGLMHPAAEDKLLTLMHANFGPAVGRYPPRG